MSADTAKNWAQKQKEREKSLRLLKQGKSNKFIEKSYKRFFLTILIVALTLPIIGVSAYFYQNYARESALEISGNIITVKAGGDFQAALNRAKSGDTILLQAGAKFVGAFILPNKSGNEYITIQTSELAKLPAENQRVSLKDAALMPKILSSGKGEPAIKTAPDAHHYRFIGIEFAPSNKDYIYNLVYLGAEDGKAVGIPNHIEIDRCYLHSNQPNGVTRRGIALNSADTIIKNSYLAEFAGKDEETQGICGWTGTKNVKILNNYIEGGAENIMFGGSDPISADLIPVDIEVRGNYLNKPAEWKDKYAMKCLFELKNSKRVQFVDNYLENNWIGAAFRITVRNDGGKAPFSVIEDAVIKDNIINGAGDGINILGTDDLHPSQMLKNLTIVNNLLLNIDNKAYAGAGYFIQVSSGENILIANNTAFNSGNPLMLYGDKPKNFMFRDNIVGHGNYGVQGQENIKSADGQKIFQNNVIVNNRRIDLYDSSFPPGNFWIQDYNAVGFSNYAEKDFRLAPNSRFKNKGKDKLDIGSNLIFKKPA